MNRNIYNIDITDVVNNIQEISNKIDEELEKEKVDKEKLFKLRYQQLMKGLYLTQNPFNNK